jgi:hypothetical protein
LGIHRDTQRKLDYLARNALHLLEMIRNHENSIVVTTLRWGCPAFPLGTVADGEVLEYIRRAVMRRRDQSFLEISRKPEGGRPPERTLIPLGS